MKVASQLIAGSQNLKFHNLLQHVWSHSSFYREYYNSHGIKENNLPEITIHDLPLLSKNTLMKNFDIAVTDSRLRIKEIERWTQDHPDPRDNFHKEFIIINSSGSSGAVAMFVYDQRAWAVANVTMAGRFPMPEKYPSGKTKVAFYMASHGHFAGVTGASRMPHAVFEVSILSLLDPVEQVVDRLNAFQPHRLVGYSSSIARLAEAALQGKLHICPKSIFVNGDLLTANMENSVRKAWGTFPHIQYGASESIYIAFKEAGQEEMTVMDDLNILEVLDNNNRPVKPGQQGRVVLTNLYNYALPILRYELGDHVVRGTGRHPSSFSSIKNIKGRVNDALPVVLSGGIKDTIHPIILSEFYAAGIEGVQFISRRPCHVQIKYVARQSIDNAIRNEFQRILDMKRAWETSFEIQRVGRIECDAQTGKLRLVKIEGVC